MDITAVASRAYCKRDAAGDKSPQQAAAIKRHQKKKNGHDGARPELFIAFDTETATDRTQSIPGFDSDRWGWRTQNLLLGIARVGTTSGLIVTDEILFYPDDLPDEGKKALWEYVTANTYSLGPRPSLSMIDGTESQQARSTLAQLRWKDEYEVTVWLMPLSRFLWEFYRIAYLLKGLVIGFNLPFDLVRLASNWGVSKSRRNAGAWALTLWAYNNKTGTLKKSRYRPNITIKKTGPRRNFIAFTSNRNADHEPVDPPWPGQFLDLGTLAYALTSRTYSLAGAVKEFCDRELDKDVEHGAISPQYIDYARRDVIATVELAKALLTLFDRHPVSRGVGGKLFETQCYSPASLAKGYLSSVGVKSPEVPQDRLGACFNAFHGGWTEMRLRGWAPVVLLDYKKMYQTQFILQDIQELLASERLEFVDDTAAIIAFVNRVTVADLFRQETWPQLRALCWVVPNGEILTTRGRFNGKNFTTGMVPRTTKEKVVPYFLADIVLAKLHGDKIPPIVRAERIVGVGKCQLQKAEFPGGTVLDPATSNIFKFNVEEGDKLKRGLEHYGTLPEGVRTALVPGIKALGNSGAFGIFAETNEDDLPNQEQEWVDLLADGATCRVKLKHPESPGRFFCSPLAGLITAGARLMLGLAHRLVSDRGGTVAFGDTDSLAIVATRDGRDVLIDTTVRGYEPELLPVKSLSWKDVEEIAAAFESLNPYDPKLIPGSILEIKEVNFYHGQQMELEALGISAKRYLLRRPDRSVADRKESILGMILSPLDHAASDDKRDAPSRWIDEAWDAIESFFRRGRADHPWLARPAVRRLAVSSPGVMRDLSAFNRGRDKSEQLRPFNFFLTATAIGRDDEGKLLSRAVVAPFERDPEKWAALEWIATETGQVLTLGRADQNGAAWRLKTVGDFLKQYAAHTSPEWLDHDGRPCNPQTRGVLRRRPIVDGEHFLLTKESMTWGDDPAHAFQTPGPEVFQERFSDVPTRRSAHWKNVVVPAIKAIGPKVVADKLQLNLHTIKRWLAGTRQPDNITSIERALAALACDLGLFGDDEVARQSDASIVAGIADQIAEAVAFNVRQTKFFVHYMGLRPFARAVGASHSTILKWTASHQAPAGMAQINTYLERVAKFARRDVRRFRRRIATDRGPAGDRAMLVKYSEMLSEPRSRPP